MTTWTITIHEKDGHLETPMIESRCEGDLFKAVLASRAVLKYHIAAIGQHGLDPFTTYPVTIIGKDHEFVYHLNFCQKHNQPMKLKWMDVSFKYHSPDVSYRLGKSLGSIYAIGKASISDIDETHFINWRDGFFQAMVVLDRKDARRLRQRLRENRVGANSQLKCSTASDGITFGNLLSMLSGPYKITKAGRVSVTATSSFKVPNGDYKKNHPLATDLVATVLDHPTLISHQVEEPPRRYISPSRAVLKWLAENNIEWVQNGVGFELTNDEDYTLYKVMFE